MISPHALLDVHLTDRDADAALRADARAGLTASPKNLPPKWFYDARGSALFERITALPEFLAADLDEPLHLALSYDEEVGCDGGRQIVKDIADLGLAPRVCIVGEPSSMRATGSFSQCGCSTAAVSRTRVAPALSPCQALVRSMSPLPRSAGTLGRRTPRLGTSCHSRPLARARSTGLVMTKVAT